jgi:hypothetical protein
MLNRRSLIKNCVLSGISLLSLPKLLYGELNTKQILDDHLLTSFENTVITIILQQYKEDLLAFKDICPQEEYDKTFNFKIVINNTLDKSKCGLLFYNHIRKHSVDWSLKQHKKYKVNMHRIITNATRRIYEYGHSVTIKELQDFDQLKNIDEKLYNQFSHD